MYTGHFTAMETFIEWSQTNHVQAPHIAIRQTPHAGYGLFCDTAISTHGDNEAAAAAAALVTIPSTLILSADRARHDRPDLVEITDDRTALRLFLALEKHSPTVDFWKPYLGILDASMEDFEQQVEGTCLEQAMQAKRSSLENQFAVLQPLFGEALTLEYWIWADRIVRSRAVGDTWMLVPFLDFANHSNEPNARWEVQPNGDMQIVPISSSTLSAGDEVLFSYGAKSNMELLFSYGFTLNDNPVESSVRISAAGFLDDPAKIAWMRQLNIPPTLTLTNEHDNDDDESKKMGWSAQSIHLMYLIVMDPEEDALTLALDEQDETTIHARVGDTQVENLNDLAQQARKLPQHPILLLRIVMLLLDATQYHYDAITDAMARIKVSEMVDRYRSEEKLLLQRTLNKLTLLRDTLAQDKVVLDYLSAQQQ